MQLTLWHIETFENDTLQMTNQHLEGHISDLRREIVLVYENMKMFVKERTNDFRDVLRTFADKVKDKLPNSEFGRLQGADERQEKENPYSIKALKQMEEEIKQQNAMKKKNKKKSHDMEL